LRAEIISIGDELTSGNRLDTNSQWLSQQLGDLGVRTASHTTVGDQLADNVRVFRNASMRSDVVIATGGLGPTADDLTREAIAQAFDAPLELRQEALDHIVQLFSKRKRPMPERNQVQAMFPRGSAIVRNPHGTAPGIDLSTVHEGHTCRIFALPGVPAEMKQMYFETIEPCLIRDHGAGKQRWFYRSLKVFGIGESDVEKLIPDLIARERDPMVGITVSKATITLRIAAVCTDEAEFTTKILETENEIREKLGLLVFGIGEHDLDAAVAQLIEEKQCRVGIVEIGSGAWIATALGKHTDPSSEFGLRAAQWYARLPSAGGCSLEDALLRLAVELLEARALDLCLAVGVYPTGSEIAGSIDLPSTDFQMVMARRGQDPRSTSVTTAAHPDVLYHRLAKTGMNFLRTELLKRA